MGDWRTDSSAGDYDYREQNYQDQLYREQQAQQQAADEMAAAAEYRASIERSTRVSTPRPNTHSKSKTQTKKSASGASSISQAEWVKFVSWVAGAAGAFAGVMLVGYLTANGTLDVPEGHWSSIAIPVAAAAVGYGLGPLIAKLLQIAIALTLFAGIAWVIFVGIPS